VSIVAILAPLLVVVVLIIIGFVVYRLFQFRRRWAERSAGGPAAPPWDVAPPTT